jgi:prepilin-type N-terminal cleavage/methylation domain-containing protein
MKKQNSRGFTVVELLIVIVLIVILTTITIFAFGDWRQRTAKTEVVNALRSASSAMKSDKNFGAGYPTSLSTNFLQQSGVTVTYMSGSVTAYCLRGASSAVPSVVYYVSNTATEPSTTAC